MMIRKINCKYLVQNIFEKINPIRGLEIVRYNKAVQNELKISKKNYEKIFKQIKIEIFPKDNLKFKDNEQNIFINFIGGKNLYHIYFDDNHQEIDRNYLLKEDQVKKIKIVIEPEFNSLKGLFKECKCIKEISFVKFNRNDIIDMSEMFYSCNSLTKINFSHFNTENVRNMEQMFMHCSELRGLKLSSFNTKNVKDMSFMFCQCNAIKDLNLSNFNTENVTEMVSMFFGCTKLKKLNLSSFNFDKVIHMKGMFNICSSLVDLDFPQTNLPNATDVNWLFNLCKFELYCLLVLKNPNLITKNVWGITHNKLGTPRH